MQEVDFFLSLQAHIVRKKSHLLNLSGLAAFIYSLLLTMHLDSHWLCCPNNA